MPAQEQAEIHENFKGQPWKEHLVNSVYDFKKIRDGSRSVQVHDGSHCHLSTAASCMLGKQQHQESFSVLDVPCPVFLMLIVGMQSSLGAMCVARGNKWEFHK